MGVKLLISNDLLNILQEIQTKYIISIIKSLRIGLD